MQDFKKSCVYLVRKCFVTTLTLTGLPLLRQAQWQPSPSALNLRYNLVFSFPSGALPLSCLYRSFFSETEMGCGLGQVLSPMAVAAGPPLANTGLLLGVCMAAFSALCH